MAVIPRVRHVQGVDLSVNMRFGKHAGRGKGISSIFSYIKLILIFS